MTKLINFHISKWWTYFLKNRYIIGHDAGSWLKVDSRTGEIQFSREFDKKSKYITNGIYTAEILAIDGKKFIFNVFIKLLVCIKYEYYSNVGRRLTQIKYIIQGCLQDLQSAKCLKPRTEFSTLTTTIYICHNLFHLLLKNSCIRQCKAKKLKHIKKIHFLFMALSLEMVRRICRVCWECYKCSKMCPKLTGDQLQERRCPLQSHCSHCRWATLRPAWVPLLRHVAQVRC